MSNLRCNVNAAIDPLSGVIILKLNKKNEKAITCLSLAFKKESDEVNNCTLLPPLVKYHFIILYVPYKSKIHVIPSYPVLDVLDLSNVN